MRGVPIQFLVCMTESISRFVDVSSLRRVIPKQVYSTALHGKTNPRDDHPSSRFTDAQVVITQEFREQKNVYPQIIYLLLQY